MNQAILIVEDEYNLGSTLVQYWNSQGKQALHAQNAKVARELFYQHNPQIVVMDIGLPDISGLDLAKEFRKSNKNFVLFFLSAYNDPATRLLGLEIGGDDYITKPFELKELTLRLERLIKGHNHIQNLPPTIEIGRLKIRFSSYELVDCFEQKIKLNHKECHILQLLYLKKNQVVSRNEIIDEVWGEDEFPSERTVDNCIVKFRKWLDSDQESPMKIQSIRGIGYKLEISL